MSVRILRLQPRSERAVFFTLSVLSALLYALYFLHPRADYPLGLLPGIDWARYTDEGWYGDAALHHAQTGQWFTPNGFNPAVALPLWPLLLRAWFAIFGVDIVAARVLTVLLFGATNLLLFVLLRPLTGRVLAVSAVLLTLADPFSFGFNRLAILEPLVGFLFLLALWVARVRPTRGTAEDGDRSVQRVALQSILTGLLLTAIVLTKTTAIALAPAVLFLLWKSARTHRHDAADPNHSSLREALHRAALDRRALLAPALAIAVAVATWSAYFFALVHPHHLADFHHLFNVNAGHASGHTILQQMARAVGDATGMGGLLWALALLLFAASLRYLRELWRVPLFGSAVLAVVLQIALIGWHTWFIPHYYLPALWPTVIVIALGLHALSRRAHAPAAKRTVRSAHTAAMLLAEAAFAAMLIGTLAAALHPQYTLNNAAQNIAASMRADQTTHTSNALAASQPKLLGASADTLALFTGIHSANPEWPIGGLPALIAQERPTFYGGYLPYDAAHIAGVRKLLSLTEVARYSIQPTPDHQVFVLYRVDQIHQTAEPIPRSQPARLFSDIHTGAAQ